MDVLPIWHFVFIACRFYEKASPHLWDQRLWGKKKTKDGNLEIGLDGWIGCLLSLVN